MPRILRRLWLPGVLALLVSLIGCGDPVYRVRGQVIFDGKPMVGGGAIAFVPLDSREGKAPGGIIKEDGSYELTTHTQGDGSRLGEFRVVITQVTEKEPQRTADGTTPATAAVAVAPADRIPAIYSDYQNSPLTAKVEAKNVNELNFDLKRQ